MSGCAGVTATLVPDIFISHRHEDADVGSFIKEGLVSLSDGKLTIFVAEDISGGAVWRQQIEDALERARYLFLIYRDPSEDWSWCFYEVGYFQALIAKDPSRRSIASGRLTPHCRDPSAIFSSIAM
jgi:hypothetical protein